jgi:4-carboxymuconolactone decarboxylase
MTVAAEAAEGSAPSRRLPPLTEAELTPAQRRLWDVVAEGPRAATAVREGGQLTGPFDVLLRSPEVGVAVAELGARLRFDSSLDARDTELVILLVAGRHRARYAWLRHAMYGERDGIPREAIQALAEGRDPELPDERGRLIVAIVTALLDAATIDDELYAASIVAFGERALVDIVALAGYYTVSSYLLNVFDVPLPVGARVPWDPPTTPGTEGTAP